MDATVKASLKRMKRNKELWDDICDANKNDDEMEERALYKMAFKTRKVYNRESYRDSFWYKFVMDRDLSDLTSRDGKFFRNRFTVPYQIFTELLIRAQEWFPQKKYDVCGRETTPIFLKLLGTLRMLGKGCSWDLLYELSGVSAEVHRKWTLSFLDKFSKEMYPIYVHGPRNSEEVNSITSLYGAAGFPGCIGSTDCVHIRWDMCPSLWFSSFKNGKNSYASISYEMTVDHSKRFQSMTIGHYGTTSDKTVVKFDGFVEAVRFADLYTQAEFKLQEDENTWIIEKGLYLLVDGGYHKWRIMQCPFKHTTDEDKIRWSEFAEAIRKDVECSFGILKKRFQFLKNAITWHRKSDIDNAVFSCVTLHNMLHEFDGYDVRWELEIENTHNDTEEQICLNKIRRRVVRALENKDDNSCIGHMIHNMNNISFANAIDNVAVEISTEHELLQNKLIRHLNMQYLNGTLRWLQI
jgi:Plant transposon protein